MHSWFLIHVFPVIKTKILSAHDKGSHAEVNVKIKKVLKSTKLKILRGKRTLYPESWTNRGCTCPILNPGRFDSLGGATPSIFPQISSPPFHPLMPMSLSYSPTLIKLLASTSFGPQHQYPISIL